MFILCKHVFTPSDIFYQPIMDTNDYLRGWCGTRRCVVCNTIPC